MKRIPLAVLSAAFCAGISTVAAGAVQPIVVWDGASPDSNFSTLTRTVGDNIYTLDLLSGNNSVANDGSFVRIGEGSAQGIKVYNQNGNLASDGALSIIIECSDIPDTADGKRIAFGLLDDGRYEEDNGIKIGLFKTENNENARFAWVGKEWGETSTGFFTGARRIAMTYCSTNGTSCCNDAGATFSAAGLKSAQFTGITGIVIGGPDGGTIFGAMTGMTVRAVAVFTNELSNTEIEDYIFPSLITSDITVSEINSLYGNASEINLNLENGVTVTGDTEFNASTIHFHCKGSFTMTPPAGNTATFDFSDVSGRPIIEYSALPSVEGSVFTSTKIPAFVTDAAQWTGTIAFKGFSVTDFESNPYGNESSAVRLENISGWLRAPGNYTFTNAVPVELAGTLSINNGMSANTSNPKRCTVFKKISGNGTIYADGTANKAVIVIQDASEFTGNIGLNGKLIVFGDAMPSFADNNEFTGMEGSIWVMEGASVTVQPPSGNWWAVKGIKLAGELKTESLDKIGGGTYITTSDTGVFTFVTSSGTVDDQAVSYARITGTGTLRYADGGNNNWRTLSQTDFPTGLICENNLTAGLILKTAGGDHTIGSLAGSGKIRSDWGAGNRNLKILQAKDTTYSGVFHFDDRIGTVTVAPGTSTAGTLTLSGTQTVGNDLVVESGAKVNITGKWIGAVESSGDLNLAAGATITGNADVSGDLSGSGTIEGNLHLDDGSVVAIPAYGTILHATGNLTLSGEVVFALPAGSPVNYGEGLISADGAIDFSAATVKVKIGESVFMPQLVKIGKRLAFYPGMTIRLK